MKNSFVPMILLALMMASIPFCVSMNAQGGMNGPKIDVGYFRGKDPRPVASTPLQATNTVEAPSHFVPLFPSTDERLGLEQISWHNTALLAGDDLPLTRSVVRGMAELLTGALSTPDTTFDMPFHNVCLLPIDGKPLPLPFRRIVRFRQIDPQPLPQQPGHPIAVRFAVELFDVVSTHKTQLRRPAGIKSSSFELVHESKSVTEQRVWAPWFAGVGRNIAHAIFVELNGGTDPVPLEWQYNDMQSIHDCWVDESIGNGSISLVPDQPVHSVATWFGSWEEPLVRGWTGAIIGTVFTHKNVTKAADEFFIDHLSKGNWRHADIIPPEWEVQDGSRRWLNARDKHLSNLLMHPGAESWILEAWQQDIDVSETVHAWLVDAAAGDSEARRHVRQHLLSRGLPQELRIRMQAVLRENASFVEQVMLGALDGATSQEKNMASYASWIRGVSDAAPMEWPKQEAAFEWDGAPKLCVLADKHIGILLHQKQRVFHNEITRAERFQLWHRQADGTAHRINLHIGDNDCDGVTLSLTNNEDGWQILCK